MLEFNLFYRVKDNVITQVAYCAAPVGMSYFIEEPNHPIQIDVSPVLSWIHQKQMPDGAYEAFGLLNQVRQKVFRIKKIKIEQIAPENIDEFNYIIEQYQPFSDATSHTIH